MRETVDARVALTIDRAQVGPGQIAADLRDLRANEMGIIEKPLGGGRDGGPAPDGLQKIVPGFAKDLLVLLQSEKEQRFPLWRVDSAGSSLDQVLANHKNRRRIGAFEALD